MRCPETTAIRRIGSDGETNPPGAGNANSRSGNICQGDEPQKGIRRAFAPRRPKTLEPLQLRQNQSRCVLLNPLQGRRSLMVPHQPRGWGPRVVASTLHWGPSRYSNSGFAVGKGQIMERCPKLMKYSAFCRRLLHRPRILGEEHGIQGCNLCFRLDLFLCFNEQPFQHFKQR